MGLLDDAIREHLDLKRRHGADPAEIERVEQEALGPVRRFPDAPPDISAPDTPTDLSALDADLDVADREDEPDLSALDAELGLSVSEHDPDLSDRGGSATEEIAPPVAGQPSPPVPAAADTTGPLPVAADPGPDPTSLTTEQFEQETSEYELHERPDRDEHVAESELEPTGKTPEENEDMLEETPEFLQDAPEHDRLWFEQRPPRDFDFDG